MDMLLSAPQWTQDESIAYESACECITDLIGILMAEVYREEGSGLETQRLVELQSAVSSLWRTRETLDIHDQSAIAHICHVYGSRIRAWRESADPHIENGGCLQDLMQLVQTGL